ncbi:MAG: flagellar export protein FliJ [Bdellovibrionales bacterium]|nr:flagellar export protein FliJ [Bdellovibrionales bacterium]
MKRFKFRLQKVLDYREAQKREQAHELARRNGQLSELEQRLEAILEAQDHCEDAVGQVVSMSELSLGLDYRSRLQHELERQHELIQEAVQAVEAARDAYIERVKETESLEVVKRRRKEEFHTEKKRRERKELNDLVVSRHRFSKPGSDDNR